MPTVSKENYLKTIYSHISDSAGIVGTAKIAQELGVSNAAITDMAKKLSKEGLITYEKYKGISLTNEGEKIAVKVIRRHRLWELFLTRVLNLAWSELHDQAEKLEHHTSDFLIDKIDEYLGFPELDPHGHPIPRKNGSMPKSQKLKSLSETEKGMKYKLVMVNDKDHKLIDYLSQIGLLLNTEFDVVDKLEFDHSVSIRISNILFSLSDKISQNIYVKQLDK